LDTWSDGLLVLAVLTNFLLVGSSRITSCIRQASVQGVLVGLFFMTAHFDDLSFGVVAMTGISVVLKGVVFPWLLYRTLEEIEIKKEIEPYVGYTLSLALAVLALGTSFWLSARLPSEGHASALALPVGFFTFFTGLFLIVSRKKALTQVLGYLVMENGVFVIGAVLAQDSPLLVEFGILLDALVAVFVMGLTIFHINRTFDSIDTDQLTNLRE